MRVPEEATVTLTEFNAAIQRAKTQAWDEGFAAGYFDTAGSDLRDPDNPYRAALAQPDHRDEED